MSYIVPEQPLPNVCLSLDDFYPDTDAMCLDELFYLKHLYPKLKVTLFAVPARVPDSYDFFEEVNKIDWIRLAPHGMFHEQNECAKWTKDDCEFHLTAFEELGVFDKVFKAPGWAYNQTVYEQLKRFDWICADLGEKDWPEGLKVYSTNHPYCVHGHTWNLNNPDPKYNNGIEQIMGRGVPWDEDTQFHFISDLDL